LAAGSLDYSFGDHGIVRAEVNLPDMGDQVAPATALQPDGKIVVAGHAFNGCDNDIALARYSTDGTLDTSFGAGGVATTAIRAGNETANGVAVQADGKIAGAGYAHNGLNTDFALLRYNLDGSLDTGFGLDGIVTTAIGGEDGITGLTRLPWRNCGSTASGKMASRSTTRRTRRVIRRGRRRRTPTAWWPMPWAGSRRWILEGWQAVRSGRR